MDKKASSFTSNILSQGDFCARPRCTWCAIQYIFMLCQLTTVLEVRFAQSECHEKELSGFSCPTKLKSQFTPFVPMAPTTKKNPGNAFFFFFFFFSFDSFNVII